MEMVGLTTRIQIAIGVPKIGEEVRFTCNNLQDDDGDGLTDADDPGCETAFVSDETHTPECADGIDNDSDGWTDLDDPICSSANTLFEIDGPGGLFQCNDGLDNDADGSIDAEDLGCDNGFDDDEQDPLTECNDGIDNDSDGWTDLADPVCSSIAVEFEDDGYVPNGSSAMTESIMMPMER